MVRSTTDGKIVDRFAVGAGGGGGVAYGDGSVWLAGGPGVVRIDPNSEHILHRISTPGQPSAVRSLVFASGFLWVVRADNGLVMKIDPVENKIVHSIPLHGWSGDLAVGGGMVWAPVVQDGQIYKLSEDDLSVQGLVPAGADPERISIGGGRLWVANAAGKTISLIDLPGRAAAAIRRRGPTTVATRRPCLDCRRAEAAPAAAHLGTGAPNLYALSELRPRPRTCRAVQRAVPVRDVRKPAQLPGFRGS